MSGDRILVVGASGMLGHEAIGVLSPDFEVWGACRHPEALPDLGVPTDRLLGGLDATDHEGAYALVERVRPDLIINAVGIIKQLADAKAAIPSIAVNSLWPHVLADAGSRVGARMVHMSTDCVFSGSRGMYTESDLPDACDLYGRSKLLGEVTDRENTLTLRTSIVGWELSGAAGLFGWFAAHRSEALKGYTKAVFSGLTTRALTEFIRDFVLPDDSLTGLWHLSAAPIDKYTLLMRLATHLGWDVDLTPDDGLVIDRSLDSTHLRTRTGWVPPSWDEMLQELADDHRASQS